MRMNKTVRTMMHTQFRRMLDQGHFPGVGWKRGLCFEYNTYHYLQFWGRMAFLVDQELKGCGYALGCYTLNRSDRFRGDVLRAVQAATPEKILATTNVLGIPRA